MGWLLVGYHASLGKVLLTVGAFQAVWNLERKPTKMLAMTEEGK